MDVGESMYYIIVEVCMSHFTLQKCMFCLQGFCCWIMKMLLKDDPYHLTPPPGSSETSKSSKTPGRDLEDRVSDVES